MQTAPRINLINTTRVLQTIWKEEGISRVEIARKLNLDKSTISKITSSLLHRGLICDKKTNSGNPGAGRKRIELTVSPDFGIVLGLEIQTEYYRAAVTDLYGKVLLTLYDKVDFHDDDFAGILDSILEDVLERIKPINSWLLGVGIGLPGTINPHEGIVCRSNPLNIENPVNIYEYLSNKYSFPVFIDNDANCCCWGDLTFTKGNREKNFLVVLGEFRKIRAGNMDERGLATGLGIVINEQVHYGANYTAGEFKSLLCDPNAGQVFSVRDEKLSELEHNREFMEEVLCELSGHLALFINTFNFTRIVFAGVYTRYKDIIDKHLKNDVRRNCIYDTEPELVIDYSPFGDNSVCYGAAGMIVEKFFSLPDVAEGSGTAQMKGIELFNYIEDKNSL